MEEIKFKFANFPSDPALDYAYAYAFGYLTWAVHSFLRGHSTALDLSRKADAVDRFVARALEASIDTPEAATPQEGVPAAE